MARSSVEDIESSESLWSASESDDEDADDDAEDDADAVAHIPDSVYRIRIPDTGTG